MNTSDTISIVLPLKAEYVSIVRLTASGIASRVGFDFDSIEDIKVAISEVLAKIIEKNAGSDSIEVSFTLLNDGICISFKASDYGMPSLFDKDADSFALAIISTLMDEVNPNYDDHTMMTMIKKLGKVV